MRFLFIIFFITIGCNFSFAQGNIRYDIEPAIEKIQADYVTAWEKVGETNGYRIQIIALAGANAKTRVEKEFQKFVAEFPEIPAYLSFVAPNFRIRVGNFFTRLQAYKTLLEIRPTHPDAYITSDKIHYLDD